MGAHFDYLDGLVFRLMTGEDDCIGALSSGERLYVILAANRADLLAGMDYTIVQAINRLDDDWLSAVRRRWQATPEAQQITTGRRG
jgi:hypothetical protein